MDAAAASAPKHSLAFILGGTNAAPTGWTINEVDAAAAAMTEMAARDHKLDVDVDVDRWSRPLPAPAPMAPRALMRLPSLGAIRSSIAPRTDRSMCDYSPEPRTAWVTMHAPTSRAVTHAKLPAHSSARNTRFKVASTISIGRTAREEHTRLVRADSLTPPLQQQSTPVAVQPTRASDGNVTHKRRPRAKNPMTAEEKRKVRACTVEGCSNYTIDRGLCFRHGGGKKCTMEGCSASAKSRGLCWKHDPILKINK
ncbi:TPA: hypothetical protein N0F65_012403 [Lagenidium giganteum]|uniref:WRKY19-like zinc finger domain-containing protein n=1 Tax=Lagenidium giganteum TaxID=4803 RepID=A0AAV2YP24_9STRA|nr:TPA: hypothetical protein N0F65_012403 [Lagenidium giganteum]